MSAADTIAPAPVALATGLVRGESSEFYHAADAWSKSKLDTFRELPLLAFKRHVEKSIPREPETRDLRIGSSVHALALEGLEAYEARYIVTPADAPKDLRHHRNAKSPSDDTKKSIAWWDKFDADNKGKMVLTRDEDELNRTCAKAIRKQPTAALLLEQGEPELTFRVKADRYYLQCRPDWFNGKGASRDLVDALRQGNVRMEVGEPYVADVKTVPSLSDLAYRNWQRNFALFGYHRQGPFYTSVMRDVLGTHVEKFFFIVQEKAAPFSCAVFLADDKANEVGWQEIDADVKALNRCYDSGVWPGVPSHVQPVKLPGWYLKKHDEEGGAL